MGYKHSARNYRKHWIFDFPLCGLYLILRTPARWYGWGCEAGDDVDILLMVVRDSYFLPTANCGDRSGWPHLILILRHGRGLSSNIAYMPEYKPTLYKASADSFPFYSLCLYKQQAQAGPKHSRRMKLLLLVLLCSSLLDIGVGQPENLQFLIKKLLQQLTNEK